MTFGSSLLFQNEKLEDYFMLEIMTWRTTWS